MKSWYCDCSRINPCGVTECLSCGKTRPDFFKNSKEFLEEGIENDASWKCHNCQALMNSHKLIRCVFCSTLRRDLMPNQFPPMKDIPLDNTDQPEFENGGSKDTSFGPEKKEYSEQDLKDFAKNANLSEAQKAWGESICNHAISKTQTPAGKFVPLELLERALTEWNNSEEGGPLSKEMLSDIFSNEFPELNLQVVGNAIKAV